MAEENPTNQGVGMGATDKLESSKANVRRAAEDLRSAATDIAGEYRGLDAAVDRAHARRGHEQLLSDELGNRPRPGNHLRGHSKRRAGRECLDRRLVVVLIEERDHGRAGETGGWNTPEKPAFAVCLHEGGAQPPKRAGHSRDRDKAGFG